MTTPDMQDFARKVEDLIQATTDTLINGITAAIRETEKPETVPWPEAPLVWGKARVNGEVSRPLLWHRNEDGDYLALEQGRTGWLISEEHSKFLTATPVTIVPTEALEGLKKSHYETARVGVHPDLLRISAIDDLIDSAKKVES